MTSQDIIQRAEAFARRAHEGQVRKWSAAPYITHPVAVADLLRSWGVTDPEVLAAAYLHDVVEDCGIALGDLRREFGPRVADLVDALTHQKGESVVRRLIGRSTEAVLVKVADRCHNLRDTPHEHHRESYIEEAEKLLNTAVNREAITGLVHGIGALSAECRRIRAEHNWT